MHVVFHGSHPEIHGKSAPAPIAEPFRLSIGKKMGYETRFFKTVGNRDESFTEPYSPEL